MFTNTILIILGFFLLIKGADYLVDGASNIAKKFNVPEIVIGFTIVAVGTSMPELVVSLNSALEGYTDLSIGNIVGSNITNLFLILGLCSIIKPLIFKKDTRIYEIPFTILITIVFFYFCINKSANNINMVTQKEGLYLLILCALFIFYNIAKSKKENKNMVEIKTYKEIKVVDSIFLILIGVLGLKIGGDLVIDNSILFVRTIGISEKIIALTIVAFSTSLPELITSIIATKKGEIDMAIGNVLGSQIFNILLIIGITATLKPIAYSTNYNGDIILLIIGTILLGMFSYIGKKKQMTRRNGVLFILIYIIYVANMILNVM